MKKTQMKRILNMCLMMILAITVGVGAGTTLGKYVFRWDSSFSLKIMPKVVAAETIEDFIKDLEQNPEVKLNLTRVVYDRWNNGYSDPAYPEINITDWNEVGFKEYEPGKPIRMFVKEHATGKHTMYVLSPENIIAPKKSDNLFTPSDANSPFATSVTEIALRNFHFKSGTTVSKLFSGCAKLTKLDLTGMDFTEIAGQFYQAGSLFSGANTVTELNLSGTTWSGSIGGFFCATNQGTTTNLKAVTKIIISGIKMENVTGVTSMFGGMSKLETIEGLSDLNINDFTNLNNLFYACSSLKKSVFLEFAEMLRQENCVNELAQTFYNCNGIDNEAFHKIINGLAEGGAEITRLRQTFQKCGGIDGTLDLTKLELTSISGRNGDALLQTFYECKNVTSIIFPETRGTFYDFRQTFYNCIALETIDLSQMDTSTVTDMRGLFQGCSSLKTVYVSEGLWSTDKVGKSTDMFTGCTSLVGGNGTAFDANYTGKTYACIDKPGQQGYFTLKLNRISNNEMTSSTSLTTKAQFDAYYADLREKLRLVSGDEIYNLMMAEIATLGLGENSQGQDPTGMNSLYKIYCKYYGWFLEDKYPDEKLPSPARYYMDHHKSVNYVVFITASNFKNIDIVSEQVDMPIDDNGSGGVRLFVDDGDWGLKNSTMYFIVDDEIFEKIIAPTDMKDFFKGFFNLKEVHFNGLLDVSGVTNFTDMFADCNKLTTVDVTGLGLTSAQLDQMFVGCESNTLTVVGGPDGYDFATGDGFVGVSVDLGGVTNALVTANGDFIRDMLYTEDGVLTLDIEADQDYLLPEYITVIVDGTPYPVSTTGEMTDGIYFDKFDWEGGSLYIPAELLSDGSVVALTIECVEDVPEEEPEESEVTEEEEPAEDEGEESDLDAPAEDEDVEPDSDAPEDNTPSEGEGDEPETDDPAADAGAEEEPSGDDTPTEEEASEPDSDTPADDEGYESEEPSDDGDVPDEEEGSEPDADPSTGVEGSESKEPAGDSDAPVEGEDTEPAPDVSAESDGNESSL